METNALQAYKSPDVVVSLCSGGIDSVTALHMAVENISTDALLYVLSFDYGQRHRRELEAAEFFADKFEGVHDILDIKNLIPQTMLTDKSVEVPNISYSEIVGVSPTYVPYRNGLLLSAATSYAVGKLSGEDSCAWIYAGMHADDAAGFAYPDCTPEWLGSQANAIYTGTYGRVRLITPLTWMNKEDIVRAGEELGIEFEETWSCYKGGEYHCGTCPTCRARKLAFNRAGIHDPTVYVA